MRNMPPVTPGEEKFLSFYAKVYLTVSILQLLCNCMWLQVWISCCV